MYIADPDLTIIYTNGALQDLLHTYADDIQACAPAFHRTANLVGQPVSLLEVGNAQDAEIYQRLDRQGAAQREVQYRSTCIAQNVSAIRDETGAHLGFVCEWRDRTAEARVEIDVADVVRSAAAGDLSSASTVPESRAFSCNWRNSSMPCSMPTRSASPKCRACSAHWPTAT